MKTPVEQSQAVIAALEELMALDADIIATGRLVFHDRILLPDLFVTAVLNRSLQLLHGFSDLVRVRNYLSATPLFRLQLDNAIRLWAGTLVPSFDDFTTAVLRGRRIDKMKSTSNKKLSDHYLVTSLSNHFNLPKLVDAYEHASGFVHLSGQHMVAANRGDGERIAGGISRLDTTTPEPKWLDLIRGFSDATNMVLSLTRDWAKQKTRPREAT
jgi:hypothetical protein